MSGQVLAGRGPVELNAACFHGRTDPGAGAGGKIMGGGQREPARLGRGHVFSGAHDKAMLQKAGTFTVARDGTEVVLALHEGGVSLAVAMCYLVLLDWREVTVDEVLRS